MATASLILASVVGAALFVATFATRAQHWSRLHNQEAWLCTLAMLGLACLAPRWSVGVLIAVIGLSLFRPAPVPLAMILIGWRTVMWVALYLLCLPFVTPDLLVWFFSLMLWIGGIGGVWAVSVLWTAPPVARNHQPIQQWTILGYPVHEDCALDPLCNQMNTNLTQSVAAVCTACGVALLFSVDHVWVIAALTGLAAAPILVTLHPRVHSLGQGWGHLLVIALAAWTVHDGWRVWGVGVPLLVAGVLWAASHEGGFQTRIAGQTAMLRFLWRLGKTPLIWGYGMGAWQTFNTRQEVAIPSGSDQGKTMPSAHNEFIQVFVEYGAVGVVALVVMLGEAAGRVYTDPIFIVGLVLWSIAMLNAPWTLTHWHVSLHNPSQSTWYGAPALTVASFAVMVLIDGGH